MDTYSKRYNRRANTNSRKTFRNELIESTNFVLNTDIWYQSHLIPKSGGSLVTVMNMSDQQTYNSVIKRYVKLQLTSVSGSFNCFYHANFKSCIPENFTSARDYAILIYSTDPNPIRTINYEIDYAAGVLTLNATKEQIDAIFQGIAPKVTFWQYIGGTMDAIFNDLDIMLRKSGDELIGPLLLESLDSSINIDSCALFIPGTSPIFYQDINMNSKRLTSLAELLFVGENGIRIKNIGANENITLGYSSGYGLQDCIVIGNLANQNNISSKGVVSIGSYNKAFSNHNYTLIGHGAGNTLSTINDGDIIFGAKNVTSGNNYDLIRANAFNSHFSPASNNTVSLGTNTQRWTNMHCANVYASQLYSNANDNSFTANCDFTVTGNFIVQGEQIITNTSTVEIEDNILLINRNMNGIPPGTLTSGIQVNRGSSDSYYFLFRESDDSFVIGELTSLQKVATREDTPINNSISIWSDSSLSFVTNSSLNYSVAGSLLTSPNIAITNSTEDYIPYIGASKQLIFDSNFKYSASKLYVPNIIIDSGVNTYVPYFNSSKQLITSSNLIYDGTKFSTNAINISGLTANRLLFANAQKDIVGESSLTYSSSILSTPDIRIINLPENAIPYINSSNQLANSNSFTFNGSKVTLPALNISALTANKPLFVNAQNDLTFDSAYDYSGSTLTVPYLKISNIPVNSVPYFNASNQIINSSNLLYDGTKLTTNAINISGLTANKLVFLDALNNLSTDTGLDYSSSTLTVPILKYSTFNNKSIPFFNSTGIFTYSSNFYYDTSLGLFIGTNGLTLNQTLTDAPASNLVISIDYNRGSSEDYRLAYYEIDNTLRFGPLSGLKKIALREDSPTNNGLAYWDNTNSRYSTLSNLTYANSKLNTNALLLSGLLSAPYLATDSNGNIISTTVSAPDYSASTLTVNNLIINAMTSNYALFTDSNEQVLSSSYLHESSNTLSYGSSTSKNGLFSINKTSTSTLTTDPGTAERYLTIQNTSSSGAASLFSCLSFGISPSLSLGAGKCIMDIKLYRSTLNSSNCALKFSAFDNTSAYNDILTLSKTLTTFAYPVTINDTFTANKLTFSGSTIGTTDASGIIINKWLFNTVASTAVDTGNDPGDSHRIVLIQNTNSNSAVANFAALNFGIAPNLGFGSGRCLLDIKLVRDSLSNCKLKISAFDNAGTYSDISSFSKTTSIFYSDLVVSGNTNTRVIGLSCDGVNGNTGYMRIDFPGLHSTTAATCGFGRTTSTTGNFWIAVYLANNTSTANHALYGNNSQVSSLCSNNGSLEIGSSNKMTVSASGVVKMNNQVEITTSQQWIMTSTASFWHNWRFGTGSTTPRVYFSDLSGTTNVNCFAGSFTPFSGCHIAKNVGSSLSPSDLGKLFLLDGTLYNPTELLQGYCNGRVCNVDKSKAIYGVIVDTAYLDQDGNFNDEVLLLSVGEGGLYVHDNSGNVNIECGDIIVSRADGYGRKLEDYEYNYQTIKYTVARARETYNGPSPYLLHVSMMCG